MAAGARVKQDWADGRALVRVRTLSPWSVLKGVTITWLSWKVDIRIVWVFSDSKDTGFG